MKYAQSFLKIKLKSKSGKLALKKYFQKGNLFNPNNLRGINLLNVVLKVILIVINNRIRLILKKIGTPIQFGSTLETGCPDGSLSIKILLQMRKETDKSTWVMFVDLITTFDSINNVLLFKFLETFRIPDRVIMVIKNFYKDFNIMLTVGKCGNLDDYFTGV